MAHAYVASKPAVPTLDDQKKKLEAELDRIGKMLEQHRRSQEKPKQQFSTTSLSTLVFSPMKLQVFRSS
ncbi:hypothetical protein V6N13_140625 [Hibiscus sabdariffa]|uniref:Uncharacterized protein n=1 Tax=Hibiscus sabdariffa TaxID=183260 RepID=A0ABR2BL57_9ROSI